MNDVAPHFRPNTQQKTPSICPLLAGKVIFHRPYVVCNYYFLFHTIKNLCYDTATFIPNLIVISYICSALLSLLLSVGREMSVLPMYSTP